MKFVLSVLCGASAAIASAQAQNPSSNGEQGPLNTKGSLFSQGTVSSLIQSRSALHKGDIVTIIVSESTTGSTSASTTSSKTDTSSYSTSLPAVTAVTNQFLTGLLKNVSNGALAGGSTNAASSTAGAGSTSTNTAFSTQITAIVTEVRPNGIMVIEGKRTYKMNKQTQTLLLQGLIRPDDVSIANTVLSQYVADMRLVADGKGLIADRQREGLLTKLLSWLF